MSEVIPEMGRRPEEPLLLLGDWGPGMLSGADDAHLHMIDDQGGVAIKAPLGNLPLPSVLTFDLIC